MWPPLITEILAAVGAVTGVTVLVFEIYKWKISRTDLDLTVSPTMQIYSAGQLGRETYVVVTAVNRSAMRTTLTNFALQH